MKVRRACLTSAGSLVVLKSFSALPPVVWGGGGGGHEWMLVSECEGRGREVGIYTVREVGGGGIATIG